MSQLMCRICLITFDDDDVMYSLFAADDEDSSQSSISFKLQATGFMKCDPEDGFPSHICGWCAARVTDAYALKTQCDVANTRLSIRRDKEPVLKVAAHDVENSHPSLSSQLAENASRLSSLSSKDTFSSTSSLVMAGVHDMITCVRELSSTLQYITSLLANAVLFADNVISFLLVLLPVKVKTLAMIKSAQSMRREAACWRRKSHMFKDVSSLLDVLPCINVHSREASHETCKVFPESQISVDPESPGLSPLPLNVMRETTSPCQSVTSDDLKSVQDFSTYCMKPHELVDENNPSPSESKKSTEYQRNQFVKALTSYQALDLLLLRKDVDFKCDSINEEKWTVVQKK